MSLEELKKQIEKDPYQKEIALITGLLQALCNELIIKKILTPEDEDKIIDNASKISDEFITAAAYKAYKKLKEDFDDEDLL